MAEQRFGLLVTPAALVVAGALVAHYRLGEGGSTLLFLTLAAGAVLTPLAATAPAREPVVPIAGLASFAALLTLPTTSPLPVAAVAASLAVAVGWVVALRSRASASPFDRRAWFGVTFAAQAAAGLDRLWLEPLAPASLVWFGLVPAVAGWLLLELAREQRAGALAVGAASFAAGPGWSGWAIAGLVLAVALARLPGARSGPATIGRLLLAAVAPALPLLPTWLIGSLAVFVAVGAAGRLPGLRRAAASALVVAATLTTVVGTMPWRRQPALERVLSTVTTSPWRVLATGEAGGALLDSQRPAVDRTLVADGATVVRVDSYLNQAVALPCGTPVATVSAWQGDSEVARTELRVGRDTAEWAAVRADVAARLACPAPEPFWWWMPHEQRYFGATYSARLRLAAPAAFDRIRIERRADLPSDVALALFTVQAER